MPDPKSGHADPDAGAATATTPPAEGNSAPFMVDAEGNFAKGLEDRMPDDLKGNPVLTKYRNLPEVFRGLVSMGEVVGKEKIAIPDEHSSHAVWEEFWKAGGRPDAPDGYDLARPAEMSEEMYSPDLAKAAGELFHQAGLSDKQAKSLFDWWNAQAMKAAETQQQYAETELARIDEQLHAEWGNAYEQRKHWGNLAIDKAVDGNREFQERLLGKFGNDPDFIRFASALGGNFVEDSAAPSSAGKPIDTPAEIDAKISKAMQHPAFMDEKHLDHKRQLALLDELYRQRHEAS